MTTFEERERAFEAKFAHDAEMQFKAFARRDRAVARWAADLMGLDEDATRDYVIDVIRTDVDDPKHEAALRKLLIDLEGKSDEATIRAKMASCMAEAKMEIAGDA